MNISPHRFGEQIRSGLSTVQAGKRTFLCENIEERNICYSYFELKEKEEHTYRDGDRHRDMQIQTLV